MSQVEGKDWASGLAEVARKLEGCRSGATTCDAQAHDGLVQLVNLNEAHARKCLEASQATAEVLSAKQDHERASLGLQNKRCAQVSSLGFMVWHASASEQQRQCRLQRTNISQSDRSQCSHDQTSISFAAAAAQ